MPTIQSQLQLLAALKVDCPVSLPVNYVDVVVMHLPNGDELVCADGSAYDVWCDGLPRQFGLTFAQARTYVEAAKAEQ